MGLVLADVATLVQGELSGDPGLVVCGVAPLDDATAGQLTMIDEAIRLDRLAQSPAAAAVVPRSIALGTLAKPVIRVDDVHAAFTRLVEVFRRPRPQRRIGVSRSAHVSATARLADDVDVHPFATIGDDVEIGPGSTIHAGAHLLSGCRLAAGVTVYPGAVLYENTVVGARSVIHAHAVIGAHGFGYRLSEGRHQRTAQLGYVELGADVEVGAGSTIDRGTYGRTLVAEGTKIDNQVQVAHNCRVGKHNLLCAQVGIAGSTTTGEYVVMAGQVGVRDHVHIGDRAVLGAMAGITNDVPADVQMLGIPATPIREQRLKLAALAKLPEMRQEFKALRATVARLEAQLAAASSPAPGVAPAQRPQAA